MSSAGYKNIERGEKGSDDKNLPHTEFKAMKEKERLEVLKNKGETEQKHLDEKQEQIEQLSEKLTKEKGSLQEIKTMKTAKKNVDAMLDSSKVLVDKTEFEEIKTLAKKQIVHENKKRRCQRIIKN